MQISKSKPKKISILCTFKLSNIPKNISRAPKDGTQWKLQKNRLGPLEMGVNIQWANVNSQCQRVPWIICPIDTVSPNEVSRPLPQNPLLMTAPLWCKLCPFLWRYVWCRSSRQVLFKVLSNVLDSLPRIRKFLDYPGLDPLARGTDLDPDPDPSLFS